MDDVAKDKQIGGEKMISTKKRVMRFFEIALIFLLFQHNVFPSQLSFVSLLLSIIAGVALVLFTDKKLYYNPYIVSFLCFMLFIVFASLFGYGTGDVFRDVIYYLMQCISSLFIFNYILRLENVERFLLVYICVCICSLLIIFFLVGDNAILSRLGHNGSGAIVSYYIAGVPIYKSSNGTAGFCAIALFFLLYYAEKFKKWYCYLPIVFLGVGIILCGSRKALLIVFIYILYAYFFINKGITIKKIVLFVGIPLTTYILLMKIPAIYNSIGIRVVSLIMNIFNESNILDGNSYVMRNHLKEIAHIWIQERPILGSGLNTFVEANGIGAENNFLQTMVEFGVIGTMIYYSFIIPLVYTVYKHRHANALMRILCIIVLTTLLQDYAGVTFLWQHVTMWYSIFWAFSCRELSKAKCIKISY